MPSRGIVRFLQALWWYSVMAVVGGRGRARQLGMFTALQELSLVLARMQDARWSTSFVNFRSIEAGLLEF
jgi:hypothetical protein